MTVAAPPRPKLSTMDKLVIMARFCQCPRCGKPLGKLADTQFDHVHARARGGSDALDNYAPLHRVCHAEKTFGRGATTRGSDIGELAHGRRLTEDEQEFRRRLAAKAAGEPKQPSKWPSRPFAKRRAKR